MEKFIRMGYGDKQIEDMWLTYFCVSSNLSTAETVVHRTGDVWKAVRTSLSIPGMFAPVLHGNDLLVDGCLLNNLPGDIMAKICKGRVIAVDVSVKTDFKIQKKIGQPKKKQKDQSKNNDELEETIIPYIIRYKKLHSEPLPFTATW